MQAFHNQMLKMIHGFMDRREPWAAEFDLNRTAELMTLYILAMKAHASGAALTATKLLEEAYALCEKYDEDWAALKDGAVLETVTHAPTPPESKIEWTDSTWTPSPYYDNSPAPGDDDLDFEKI